MNPSLAGAFGAIVGAGGRFASHVLSGVVFFAEYAPEGQSALAYSIAYNATYMIPSAIACGVVAAAVLPLLDRAVPVTKEVAA